MGKSNRLSWLKKPRFFIPFGIIVLISAAAVMAILNLNSPAVGTVTTSNTSNVSAEKTQQPDKKYKGRYFSFTYPSSFESRPVQNQPGYLDNVSFVGASPHDVFINIGLFKASISTDSGVGFRKDRPQEYKVVPTGPSSIVFSKNDGKEYTGFIQHGGYELTVSVTTIANSDLASIYNAITQSLQWKV